MDPHGAVILDEAQGPVCPICCDSELDNEELTNPLCQCGYQVCSFCIHRIQTESDNSCPHCRTSFDPEPQAELKARLEALAEQREKQEKLQRLHQPTRRVATPPASPPAHARLRGPSANGGSVLEVPRRAGATAPKPAPPSPSRNLRLGQESQWPGLGATPSPRGRQPPPPPPKSKQQAARGTAAVPPPLLPPVAVSSGAPETPPYGMSGWGDSRSASSAPTASGTPPSPATTLQMRYYGNTAVPGSGDPLSTSGECIVVLRGAGGGDSSFESDPEGAEQVAALREAVKMGRTTPAAAAAAVVGRLRERRAALGAFTAGHARAAMAPPPGFGGDGAGGGMWGALPPQEPSGATGAGLFADWGAPSAPQFDGLSAPNGLPPSAVFPSSSLGLVIGSSGGGGGGGEGTGARGPPPGFSASAQEMYGLAAPGTRLG